MPERIEFDQIAPFYDETRPRPSGEEVDALAELLAGATSVLDAGVGTGRFAVPLSARSFRILGVDLSTEMMRRARSKGITALVRADLRHLPLRDESVDAGYMAHVLQLLPDPRPVLRELGRVARRTVVVFVPEWAEATRGSALGHVRARYRAIAQELGYPLPERGRRYSHGLAELSAIAPPREVRELERSREEGTSPEERLHRWISLSFGTSPVPPAVHEEIVHRLRTELPTDVGSSTRDGRVRYVAWNARDLRKRS